MSFDTKLPYLDRQLWASVVDWSDSPSTPPNKIEPSSSPDPAMSLIY